MIQSKNTTNTTNNNNNNNNNEEDEEEEEEDDDDGMAWHGMAWHEHPRGYKRIQEDTRRFSRSPNLSSQSVWDWPPMISADKDGI